MSRRLVRVAIRKLHLADKVVDIVPIDHSE